MLRRLSSLFFSTISYIGMRSLARHTMVQGGPTRAGPTVHLERYLE